MAEQKDVTGMSPSGQREWADGLKSAFHAWCAPPEQIGLWRRVPA
jgi:hypothetical protein